MKPRTVHLAGTGCCLMDYLYTRVDFTQPLFQSGLSQVVGDGGLRTGGLVFAEDFERYLGRPFPEWLRELTGGRPPDAENLGGPAVVSLIHAAQMHHDHAVRITFHAGYGEDQTGQKIKHILAATPVEITGYKPVPGPTPTTVVLSDPGHHGGKGERSFINTIGAAGSYAPTDLDDDFFAADIKLFGATALVPQLHDALAVLLRKAKAQGGINVVGTVYDFRNEQRNPARPWPLGASAASYPLMDLLVCDHEEALKISGQQTAKAAIDHFVEGGVGAVIVTHGAQGCYAAARDGVFQPLAMQSFPVCRAVDEELERVGRDVGDTTGCGDNFLGGVLTSLLDQWCAGHRRGLNLVDACAWGAASGGFACFYPGGTYLEKTPGEKRQRVTQYLSAYRIECPA